MPTILVEITPNGDRCEDCNLLIFDDTGAPPYCAAGHHVVCTGKYGGGFPDRPPECKSKEQREPTTS